MYIGGIPFVILDGAVYGPKSDGVGGALHRLSLDPGPIMNILEDLNSEFILHIP